MNPRDLSNNPEYVPGRGAVAVARERGLDPADMIAVASNENALGPAPAAVEALRAAADSVHRYPKSTFVDLRSAIADRWDLASEQIWLANGGDAALDYLARAMLDPGDSVLVPDPGFAYYEMSARFHHGTADTYAINRADDFTLAPETVLSGYQGQRIVYLTSPHNPTGAVCSVGDIEAIARQTDSETLIVVDEAYGEFSGVDSAIDLISSRDDVAVLRSFSKSYGLAGLRLGYAVVPDSWADAFTRVNTPFAASDLACRAGLAALTDSEHLEATIKMAKSGRQQLRDGLYADTWPSGGNFVLAAVEDGTLVADRLMDRGIVVRDCSSFGLPDCIRITVAPTEPLQRVIEACNDVVSEGGFGG